MIRPVNDSYKSQEDVEAFSLKHQKQNLFKVNINFPCHKAYPII